jgi:hypothetical protein
MTPSLFARFALVQHDIEGGVETLSTLPDTQAFGKLKTVLCKLAVSTLKGDAYSIERFAILLPLGLSSQQPVWEWEAKQCNRQAEKRTAQCNFCPL